MPYLLDILLGVIVLYCVVRGIKRGFIRSAFSILSFLMAGILAFMCYAPFTEYVQTTQLGASAKASMYQSIYQSIAKMTGQSGSAQENTGAAAGQQPDRGQTVPSTADKENGEDRTAHEGTADDKQELKSSEDIVNYLKLPGFMAQAVYQQSDFLIRTASLTLAEAVSKALADALFGVICGILLFILLLIAIRIARMIFEWIFRLPLLKEVNRLAGALAGLINGALVCYLIMALISSLSGFSELAWIRQTAEQSCFFHYMYENNIILDLFIK